MRVFCTAAVIALLAGPAFGQAMQPMQRYGEPDKEKSPSEKAAERDAEKAYQRSLGNIPEKQKSDPWGSVRSDPPPKAVAKDPPAKRTKADSTAK